MRSKTLRLLARGFMLFGYIMIAVSLYGIWKGLRQL